MRINWWEVLKNFLISNFLIVIVIGGGGGAEVFQKVADFEFIEPRSNLST